MRRRFQTQLLSTGEEQPAETPFREALPVWLIGVLLALSCLWLARLGSPWLVAALIAAGLLALRGRRQAEWLWWFPTVAVAASALDAMAPLASSSRFGDLLYLELLAIALAVLGLVRAIALDSASPPRTAADRPIAAMLGLFAATLLLPGTSSSTSLARDAMTAGIVFYATASMANRPDGARWAWLAFPTAAGLAGLFAMWAAFSDPKGVAVTLARLDQVWGTSGSLWLTLVVSIPLGFGLAMNSGPAVLRHLCTVLLNLGVLGAIALVLAGTRPVIAIATPDRFADVVRALLLSAALVALAVYAELNRRNHPHESPRWLVAAATLAICAAGVLAGLPMRGPAGLLLAIAGGLVIGALGFARRGTSIAPSAVRDAARPVSAGANAAPALGPERMSDAPAVAQAEDEVHLPQTLISVVIVAHRSLRALGPCLSALSAARLSVPMEVVVVDNDSGDGTLDWIRREHPWVGTIASSTNVGFARGVNLGVTEACGDLLLVLNPNCEVSAEALEAMCEAAGRAPALAAVAPMLLDSHGRPSRSYGRFPSLWTLACDSFGLAHAFPRSRWFAGSRYGERAIDSLDRVDWASGACLLIPRAVWDAVGTLDDGMSRYMEEADWCHRAARAGRNVRFVPAARVVHHGPMPTKPVFGDEYQDDLRSRIHYFRKHHGPLALAAAKSILMTSLAVRWGVSSMRATSRPLANVYARGVSTVWTA